MSGSEWLVLAGVVVAGVVVIAALIMRDLASQKEAEALADSPWTLPIPSQNAIVAGRLSHVTAAWARETLVWAVFLAFVLSTIVRERASCPAWLQLALPVLWGILLVAVCFQALAVWGWRRRLSRHIEEADPVELDCARGFLRWVATDHPHHREVITLHGPPRQLLGRRSSVLDAVRCDGVVLILRRDHRDIFVDDAARLRETLENRSLAEHGAPMLELGDPAGHVDKVALTPASARELLEWLGEPAQASSKTSDGQASEMFEGGT